jgi:signal transduction histidine kinase
MRSLVTRALLVCAGLMAGVLVATTALLVFADARARAHDSDLHDMATVAAVLAITSNPDAVRGAIARTGAGAQGRLAVRFPDGTTIGASHPDPADTRTAATVASDPAIIEISNPAPINTDDLVTKLAALGLLTAVAALAAVRLGRRPFTPMLDAVRVLSDAAAQVGHTDPRLRIRLTGPTELVALAAAINAAADRTEDLLAKEREMIADVSHRLRTPLTALRLDADAVGSGAVADRIRSAVTTLGHDVDRIIESLQPIATAPTTSSCDVAAVVRARMLFWSTHAEDQGRPCEVDLPAEPTPVLLSPETLGAVLDALLDNIFQHTPAQTALSVAVVQHAGWITLVVEDAGPGIADPEAALHRGTSGRGSTGLGLDIARTAAEATGGTIHIERGRQGGARIRLRFSEAHTHHTPQGPRAWRLWRTTHH